ncbi:MAG: fibronectin type III domain-containing protein [Bacteroidetes bacterium]|jgi:hypothetical protein|nr:fibronectin type III domain-containing protein [Bacteroidota bacterium]
MRTVLFVFCCGLWLLAGGCAGTTDSDTSEKVDLQAPSGLAAQRIGRTSVRLTWTDEAIGEEAFVVERRRNAGAFVPTLFVPADVTQAVDSVGVIADSTYTYRVRASRYVSTSPYSNTVSLQFTLPYP